jgi:2',3'-cyclic-nucleotide 2'-phosphodiesterase (5'-nucleotidase family)
VEGGGYRLVTKAGRDIAVNATSTVEDATLVSMLAPYKAKQDAYNATVVGQTTQPINTNEAFTVETNGANLQADAAVWELETKLGNVDIDVHLSGAMTNSLIATGATPAAPVTLTVADMFTAMPYENSLLVLRMNGPQLKRVLERAYRNYYYYKYVTGWGGYSHYTTCMIDTDKVGKITYYDTYPQLPNGNNVTSFTINGTPVDFTNATKFYNVSTVNYLAAGSCNFNDNGVSLWLDGPTIVADTQFYVRDAVINYVRDQALVSPIVEGRLTFLTMNKFFYFPSIMH